MTACALAHELDGPADGPPLLLGPSLGTTRAMWDPQVAALSAGHRLVRYDARGHGASPAPPGPYELADLGGDVLALLDALEIERASFAGVSLGAMTAMWLAIHAPERVDRLVLCCTSAHMPPPERWYERIASVRAAGSVAAVAEGVVERWFTPGFAEREPATVAGYVAMLAGAPPDGYVACCEAIARMDLRDDLARIGAPTLVVAGADDLATPREHTELIAATIPGARLAVVADAAHLAPVEQADIVSELILDHLEPRSRP